MIVSFAMKRLWRLIRAHLSMLAFVANVFGVLVMQSFPMPMSWMVLPRLSSRVYMVLGHTFKSLIHPSGVNFCIMHKEVSAFCLWLASFPNTIFLMVLFLFGLSKIRWL